MPATTKKLGTWAATLLAAASCGWALWTVAGDLGESPPRPAQAAAPRPASPSPVTPPVPPSVTPPPTSVPAVPGPDPTRPAQPVVGRTPVVTTSPDYPAPTVEFPSL